MASGRKRRMETFHSEPVSSVSATPTRTRGKKSPLLVILIILFILALLFGVSYLCGWTNPAAEWLNRTIPGINWNFMVNPSYSVAAEAVSEPADEVATIEEIPREETPEDVVEPTVAQDTTVAIENATDLFTFDGYVTLKNGDKIPKYVYAGGYHPEFLPYMVNFDLKHNPGSFGVPIVGTTDAEMVGNWIPNLVLSPEDVVDFRTDLSLANPSDLEIENIEANELAALPAAEYDKYVNTVMSYFYAKLEGGSIEASENWNLELYMDDEVPESHEKAWLRARTNSDDSDPRDRLLTFLDKEGKYICANPTALKIAAKDAKVNASKYSERIWYNMLEGGTRKWKLKRTGGNTPPDPQTDPPTNPPTPTPTNPPPPTNPPTDPPTPTPFKNPEEIRTPKPGDDLTGEASTQTPPPERKTDAPVTSTPRPAVTATPKPTATPAPTAVINTPEPCFTPGTDVRDDLRPVPTATALPSQKPQEAVKNDPPADDSFDPGSI